ncbi:MAG: hypothetical protein AAFO95_01435 [Cyanobacteria bacterium J06600_6]
MVFNKWYLTVGVAILTIALHFWRSDNLITSSLTAPSLLRSSPTQPSTWQSVKIGGGGYITGIYPHPTAKDLVYIRTDNGGFYRWQTDLQQWLPISNDLPRGDWDYDHNSGGEAIALDPQNPDLIYIAVGKYTDTAGTIFKSSDRGATWQRSDLAVGMGGDEDKRWAGDRLAVSPFNSQLLLFGSRRDGLWRSLDGGNTWTQVTQLAVKPENHVGVLNVAFDPKQENLVYASVYRDGVYQSRDSGATWEKLKNSPRKAMQLKVAKDGVVYVTSSDAPQVSKYIDDRWFDISPKGFISEVFNALSLHPQDPQTLLVSEGEKGRAKIFYSDNGGNSWQKKKHRLNQNITWLAKEFFNDHPSAIAFNPQNPQQVWLTDWFSVWQTEDIQAATVEWQNQVAGIEQTVLFSLLTPPEGATLLSGIADQDGFYHHDLNAPPSTRFGFQRQGYSLSNLNLTGDRYLDNYFQDTFHLAYCPSDPQNLVRLGGQRWRNNYLGVTSGDGGKSWQPWKNIPQDTLFMRTAIAANNCDLYVVTTSENQPLVTQDGGQTWQKVTGLPNGKPGPWNWNQPLAADGVNGDRFYYYQDGKVYRSSDGGQSFQEVVSNLPQSERYVLTTTPAVEGEIWLSLAENGLYHSVDGGISFSQIQSINSAYLVTVGKPINKKYTAAVYVYGEHDNRSGLFFTSDGGNNWQKVNNLAEIPRSTKVLTASKQYPGLVFAGTDGRGIYYQQIDIAQLSHSDKNQPCLTYK